MIIQENVLIGEMTTMKIGGLARYFCEPTSVQEIAEGVKFAHEKKISLLILGGGSNMLMSDEKYPGLVMRMKISHNEWALEEENIFLTVGSSDLWDKIVSLAVARSAWGLENLSSIPGTVGGAVVQNIGAYGSEVRNAIEWVEVYDPQVQSVRVLTNTECQFGYRDSIFKREGKNLIVTRVRFRLKRNGGANILYKDLALYFANNGVTTPSIKEVRDAVVSIRSEKFPDIHQYGTAGSFFKNPVVTQAVAENFLQQYPNAPHYDAGEGMVKLSAAWIIDNVLEMKGARDGDVGTWGAQALVVVNYGNASSEEVKKFIQKISDASFKKIKIILEPEVILVDVKNIF